MSNIREYVDQLPERKACLVTEYVEEPRPAFRKHAPTAIPDTSCRERSKPELETISLREIFDKLIIRHSLRIAAFLGFVIGFLTCLLLAEMVRK